MACCGAFNAKSSAHDYYLGYLCYGSIGRFSMHGFLGGNYDDSEQLTAQHILTRIHSLASARFGSCARYKLYLIYIDHQSQTIAIAVDLEKTSNFTQKLLECAVYSDKKPPTTCERFILMTDSIGEAIPILKTMCYCKHYQVNYS